MYKYVDASEKDTQFYLCTDVFCLALQLRLCVQVHMHVYGIWALNWLYLIKCNCFQHVSGNLGSYFVTVKLPESHYLHYCLFSCTTTTNMDWGKLSSQKQGARELYTSDYWWRPNLNRISQTCRIYCSAWPSKCWKTAPTIALCLNEK